MTTHAILVRSGAGSMTGFGRHLWLAWREARPIVQLMFQLRFLAGALLALASASPVSLGDLMLGAGGWLCATWYVYLLNGIHDQVEDRGNASGRPIASGALPIDSAHGIARLLLIVALILGFCASWPIGLLTAAMLGLGWLYSAAPQPQKAVVPGSMVVIILGGLATYLAGWHAGGGSVPSVELMVLAISMSLWMGLVGLTKDLSDISGDRAAGRRTLAIVLGDVSARWLLAAHAVGVGLLACTMAWIGARSWVAVFVVLLVGGLAVAITLAPAFSDGDRSRRRRPYRMFALTQYVLHLAVVAHCLVMSVPVMSVFVMGVSVMSVSVLSVPGGPGSAGTDAISAGGLTLTIQHWIDTLA